MKDDAVAGVNPREAEPRVQPRGMDALPAEWRATLEAIPGHGLKGAGFPRHVLGTLMHGSETLGRFLGYWVHGKTALSLSSREQELVILRMACLYRSDYVWKHHVVVGREYGVTDAELAAVRDGSFDGVSSPRERVLLGLTDELVEQRGIRSAVWQQQAATLPPGTLVDLIALISQYVLFALTNNAFQVQVEDALADLPGLADR